MLRQCLLAILNYGAETVANLIQKTVINRIQESELSLWKRLCSNSEQPSKSSKSSSKSSILSMEQRQVINNTLQDSKEEIQATVLESLQIMAIPPLTVMMSPMPTRT